MPPEPQVAISRLSPVIHIQSTINLKTTTHSRLYTTGKQQDASGQEGWPPLQHTFLDRPCTVNESPLNLQSTTAHSRQLYTTGKNPDASGKEGWPPPHLLYLDRLAVFAFLYFLHDRTPYTCNFFGMSRVSWRCRHCETTLRSILRHNLSVLVLFCIISTNLEYDKRIAYS